MVNLTEFEVYWQQMLNKVPALKSIHFVTEEGEISAKLNDIKKEEQPFALVVIPSAKSTGSTQDNFQEENLNLIYILSKEDAFNKTTFELQKDTQPVMEAVKEQMLMDKGTCGLMRNLDPGSFQTDPEKKKFTTCSGWSLSFSFVTAP
jgi:hypothetical protein